MSEPKTTPPAAAGAADRREVIENLGGTLGKTSKNKKTNAQPKSWRDVIAVHPAAKAFPPLSEDDLLALGEDIKDNGMKVPVLLSDDMLTIYDGCSRFDAMERVGLDVILMADGPVVMFGPEVRTQRIAEGVDPFDIVRSLNGNRRHLDAAGKRKALDELIKADPSKSNRAIAEKIDVDHKTVAKARSKLERSGDVSPVAKTTGKDGKSRPAKKPRKPAKAKPKSPDRAPELPSNVVLLDVPDLPAFLIKDPEARAKAEEVEYEKVVAAYSTLTPKVKQRFLDYVIAGQTASVIDAALARLEDHTRRELADRILRTPPDLGGAA